MKMSTGSDENVIRSVNFFINETVAPRSETVAPKNKTGMKRKKRDT
jgi:hypothetical protein